LGKAQQKKWFRYLIAVALVLVGAGLRIVLYRMSGNPLPYMTFFPVVIAVSLFAGIEAGLIATLLSMVVTIVISTRVVSAMHASAPTSVIDPVGLTIFAFINIGVVYLSGAARRGRDRAEAAALANARLAAIVASSDDAIISKSPDGIILSWNAGAQRTFGYTSAEIVGKSMEVLLPPDRSNEEAEILTRLHNGERLDHFETVRVRKDGVRIDVAVSISPIHGRDGQVIAYAKIARDITDLKLNERHREHMLEVERAARAEAERAGRMKDEFLATLSHELRTPLNAILGWSQLLRRDSQGEDLSQGLEAIERNARAQTQIIGDLLDMSRIISGKLRLEMRRINLMQVMENAFETVRPAAEAKGIRLDLSPAGITPMASGDPNRLQQVFWNLLSNAIRFTPRGGQIRTLVVDVDHHWEINITDTGAGIDPDFLPYVFDRFRQADGSSTRKHGGLGLGLAITKQLVELHGGTVRVISDGQGKGATFTVSLPIQASAESPQPGGAIAATDISPVLSATLRDLKILVVDDEPDARALLSRLLKGSQANVHCVSSAAEALRLIEEQPPDVLVSDIGMPDEDGYSLIRKVRRMTNERARNLPAVAVTAYARSEDRSRAVLSGYQMHIAKPVEAAELIAMVASLAGRVEPTS
jgi:PAS domain S-box-containing protein